MADRKISELTNIPGANLADDDEFALVDTSADETKAITFGEFKTALDTATGFVRITGDTMTGNLSMGDNVKAIFGASSDLQIFHNANNSYVQDVGTGKLHITSNGTGVSIDKGTSELMATFDIDGAVTLYHDNSQKLATTSTGVNITGNLTADYLAIGTTSDAYTQILINSSTSGESELRMGDTDTDAGSIAYTNSDDTMTFRAAAGARMALDSTGLDISGTLTSNGLTVDADTVTILDNRPSSIAAGDKGIIIGRNFDTPNRQVEFGGTFASFGQSPAFYVRTADKLRLKVFDQGDISFYEDTGTTAKLHWSAADERLGIGTSSPSDDVEISTSADARGITIKNAGNNRPYLNFDANRSGAGNNLAQLNFKWNGTDVARIIAVAGSDTTNKDDGHITFNTSSAGSVDEAMRISSAGNVGIGTSAPVRSLSLFGTLPAVSFHTSTSGSTSSDGFQIQANSTDVYLWNYENTPVRFATNGTERMRLDASGNLWVGGFSMPNSGVTGQNNFISSGAATFASYQPSTAGSTHIYFNNPNGTVGQIYTVNSSTVFATSSDYRLKENVVELTNATTRLKQLEPKRFNFIADTDDTTVDGFLAHEVQTVVPEAIIGEHNEVDADGNPVYQGIDQAKLVPLLVATIQELEARITALENA